MPYGCPTCQHCTLPPAEALPLFTPAPAVMPGQTTMEESSDDLLDPEGSGYVAEPPWDYPSA